LTLGLFGTKEIRI